VQHWKEGGHDKLCKLIKKAGGAEQYNANKKYTEAVSVAAEACAEDTKGQTCYICTQALHWKTKEGLVRGCACRGTAGFAHVSCLAEQAKILYAEAEENNLDDDVIYERFKRWYACSLCEQDYHGVVRCALGWACWKMYLGRPEEDYARRMAMNALGNGIFETDQYADALPVRKAELATLQRLGAPEDLILATQSNLASNYEMVGRREEALSMFQEVYSGDLRLYGKEHPQTLLAANNYANSFTALRRFVEAKSLLRQMIPVARRVLGEGDRITLTMRKAFAEASYKNPGATLDDLREAVATLEETTRTARRVLGGAHPLVLALEGSMRLSREALHARESGAA
jgi:hypothetical protein